MQPRDLVKADKASANACQCEQAAMAVSAVNAGTQQKGPMKAWQRTGLKCMIPVCILALIVGGLGLTVLIGVCLSPEMCTQATGPAVRHHEVMTCISGH